MPSPATDNGLVPASAARLKKAGSLPPFPRWYSWLYRTLEEPHSSPIARRLSVVMLLLILVSVLGFVLETDPALYKYTTLWLGIEIVTTSGFLTEYVLRLLVCVVEIGKGVAGKKSNSSSASAPETSVCSGASSSQLVHPQLEDHDYVYGDASGGVQLAGVGVRRGPREDSALWDDSCLVLKGDTPAGQNHDRSGLRKVSLWKRCFGCVLWPFLALAKLGSSTAGAPAGASKPPSALVFRLNWMVRPLNVSDLLAILPLFFSLLEDNFSVLRILRIARLFRIFRLFKLSRYNTGFRVLAHTLLKSVPALQILLFFVTLGMVLFGSLVFYAELFDCPEFGMFDVPSFTSYTQECLSTNGKSKKQMCCRYSCNAAVGSIRRRRNT